ncbi:MAG: hypothetical protein JO072_01530 [Parafilimonas sp.]|nr:hypothetical protein [Parafilimonas sp.]
MKKVIVYAAACVLFVSSVYATPGSKILQRFKETFPNAQNVKWIDDKAGYFVSFTQNGNFNKVFYNPAGNFVYSLKYLNADGLPLNITMQLNKQYGETKVLGVTEVTTQNNMFYDVKMSKENKLYSVNILADGSITKEEVYDNGTPGNK